MSTDVSVVNQDTAVTSAITTPDEIPDFLTRQFIPNIKMYADTSSAVKKKEPGAVAGAWYIEVTKEEHEVLGEQVRALALGVRLKALDFTDKKKTKVSCDPKDPEFQRIKAFVDKWRGKDCPMMYGAEILLYLIDEDKFVNWYAASKTARKESGVLVTWAKQQQPFYLKNRLADTGEHTYTAPSLKACNTSFEFPVDYTARALKQIELFNRPQRAEEEAAQEADPSGTNARD